MSDLADQARQLIEQALAGIDANPAEARGVAHQALDCARAANRPELVARALALIAESNWVLRCYTEVAGPARESLALAVTAGDRWSEYRAANYLGLAVYAAGDSEAAVGLLKQSLQAAQQVNREAAGRVHNNLGVILNERGEFALALEHHQAALDCYQQAGVSRELGPTHVNIGTVYANLGDWERSLEFYYRALVENEKQGDKLGIAICYINVAETYLRRGKAEPAIQSAQAAVRFAEEAGAPAFRLMALGRLGEACQLAGDVLRARSTFEGNVASARELELPVEQADNLRRLADLLLTAPDALRGEGDPATRARSLADEARALAGESGPPLVRAAIFDTLGKACARAGDAAAARTAFEAAYGLVRGAAQGYDLARIASDYGRFLVEQGLTDRGLELVREAAAIFKRLDVTSESLATEHYLLHQNAGSDRRLSLMMALASLARRSLPIAEFAAHALELMDEVLAFSDATFFVEAGREFLLGRAASEEELRLCRRGEPAQTASAVCLPLRPGDRNVGGVILRFEEKPAGTLEPSLLDAVSDLLSVAVERSRRHPSAPAAEQGRSRYPEFIGESPVLNEIFDTVERVAPTNAPVMIRGESGSGKEVIARIIVRLSPRRTEPLVTLNCAALPETLLESEMFGIERGTATGVAGRLGRFEQAHRGTLFLDEIGDMSLQLQTRLLRVLQEHQFERVGGRKTIDVDTRVIAATNKNLEQAVARGEFREDLYYRLNVITVTLPALRERLDDIPLLVRHFLARYNEEFQRGVRGLSPEVLDILLNYTWPGNTRELMSVIERAVIISTSDTILPDNLPPALRVKRPPHAEPELKNVLHQRKQIQAVADSAFEKNALVTALAECEGNVTRAAGKLGISRMHCYRLLKKHNLK